MNADEAISAIAERLNQELPRAGDVYAIVCDVIDQRNELVSATIGAIRHDDLPITIETNNRIGESISLDARVIYGRVAASGVLCGPLRIRVTVTYDEDMCERRLALYNQYEDLFPYLLPRGTDLNHGDQLMLTLGYAQGRLVELGFYTREDVNEHLNTGKATPPRPVRIDPIDP